MAIIGISGKIGTGKDTVGNIIQSITQGDKENKIAEIVINNWIGSKPTWQIVKFADALKDIVCILTGCTRKQLEDIDFKNSKLPDEWNKPEGVGIYDIMMNLLYQEVFTYRMLLQYLGTDLLRNQLHKDVWVNALFNNYKVIDMISIPNDDMFNGDSYTELIYPNWIITDVRFPNEAKAIKDRNGIIIRINRNLLEDSGLENIDLKMQHPSETALDNYNFDYIIDNNGTIEELIKKVKEILIKENIL